MAQEALLESPIEESHTKTHRRSTKRHLTTLIGPQAEAILKMLDETGIAIWHDKSVPGAAVVELWTE